jgi:MtN3 and saliva related transmembrane protein
MRASRGSWMLFGMDHATLLGSAGTVIGLLAAISLLLQARRLAKLGSACEVSIPVRLLALAGYAIWLAYGVAIGDLPLILVDLAGVMGAALVLQVTFSLRRRRACPTF